MISKKYRAGGRINETGITKPGVGDKTQSFSFVTDIYKNRGLSPI